MAVAQASSEPPVLDPAQLCAAAPELLDVTVAGQARGTLEVRRSPGVTLVDPAALRDSEARYAVQSLSCDGDALVRLAPELDLTYDPRTLSLRVAARPALLPGGTLDLRSAGPQAQSAVPSFGVAYGAVLNWGTPWDGAAWTGVRGAAILDLFAAQGRASASAGLDLRRSGDLPEWRPHARMSYEIIPGWQVAAAYDTEPFGLPGTLLDRRFRGIALRAGDLSRELDRLDLSLPLDARVTINVDGVPLTTVDARAGELLLRNLPLGTGGSVVTVEIEDANGRRVVRRVQDGLRVSLSPGAYLLDAEAGWETGRPLARASGALGLRSDWTLNVAGDWTPDSLNAEVAAVHAFEGGRLSFGAGTQPEPALTASLDRELGRASLEGTLSVPVAAPGQARFGLGAGYALDQALVYARVGAAPGLNDWNALAGGYLRLNRSVLGATVSAGPGRFGASLSLTWTPRDNLLIGSAVNVRHSEAQDVTAVQSRFRVLYRPVPGQVLEAGVESPDLRNSALAYTYDRQLYARVGVSGRGLDTAVAGAVTLAGGRLVLGRTVSARTLLIRTGIPGIPLRINGAAGAVTDARGEVLAALDPALGRVRVDLVADDLPFNVTAREETTSLWVQGNGVVLLDWQGNFEVSRWVQLFWAAGEPARATDLHLRSGSVLPADPDGYVLLPPNTSGTGTLRSQDGTRQCEVQLGSARQSVCLP